MKVFIFGLDSKIGKSLSNQFIKKNFKVSGTSRNKFNISKNIFFFDLESSNEINFDLSEYDICIICFGITKIDFNNLNKRYSNKINYYRISLLLNKIIRFYDVKIILFSSNLTKIFYENNAHSSIRNNYYAYLKFKIEKKYQGKLAIIRLPKIIFPNHDLFDFWIESLEKNKVISPYDNCYFSPIYIDDLFSSILCVSDSIEKKIYDFSPTDEISYYKASLYIAKRLNLNRNLIQPIKNNSIKNFIQKNTLTNKIFTSYDAIENYIKLKTLND